MGRTKKATESSANAPIANPCNAVTPMKAALIPSVAPTKTAPVADTAPPTASPREAPIIIFSILSLVPNL